MKTWFENASDRETEELETISPTAYKELERLYEVNAQLVDACVTVVSRWESGDLATAVRQCVIALQMAKGEGSRP